MNDKETREKEWVGIDYMLIHWKRLQGKFYFYYLWLVPLAIKEKVNLAELILCANEQEPEGSYNE